MRATVLDAGLDVVHLQVADQIRFTSPYTLAAGQSRPSRNDHIVFDFELDRTGSRIVIRRVVSPVLRQLSPV